MSNPIVIVFERHQDPIPKAAVTTVLDDLVKRAGYRALAVECPHDLSDKYILARSQLGLKRASDILNQAKPYLATPQAQAYLAQHKIDATNLSAMSFDVLSETLKQFFSSKQFVMCAEQIKGVPGAHGNVKLLACASKLNMVIKGVDIDSKRFDAMMALDISKRVAVIQELDDERTDTIFSNLLKLNKEHNGVVFMCGSSHAEKLIDKFQAEGLSDQIVYYFLHSNERYFHHVDDVELKLLENPTLIGRSHQLSDQDVSAFAQKIMEDISSARHKRNIKKCAFVIKHWS